MARIVGVRFKRACKIYDFSTDGLDLKKGDTVVVEVENGIGIGTVVYGPKEVEERIPLKKVIRKADEVDFERDQFNREHERDAARVCRERIEKYSLPMKLVGVEYFFDASKAVFYFTSDTRVDFRELVKDLAQTLYTRIEMRQIGVRDEAKLLGGIGVCGRALCCASHLPDFVPVTVKMAKEQNLVGNLQKISGACGRLMCCLSYEYEGPPPSSSEESEGESLGR
jgi:cell fate regulator YaaT (PSP1 superfamily)